MDLTGLLAKVKSVDPMIIKRAAVVLGGIVGTAIGLVAANVVVKNMPAFEIEDEGLGDPPFDIEVTE